MLFRDFGENHGGGDGLAFGVLLVDDHGAGGQTRGRERERTCEGGE